MIIEQLQTVVRALRTAAAIRHLDSTPVWQSLDEAFRQDYEIDAAGDSESGEGESPDGELSEDDANPLARIGEVFGLLATELDLLMVAAASDLDSNIATAYGVLQGADGPRPASVWLALELCGIPRLSGAGRSLLVSSAALRRWGLIRTSEEPLSLSRSLTVSEDVVAALLDFPVADSVSAAMSVPTGSSADSELNPAGAAGSTTTVARMLTGGAPLVWVEDATAGAGHTTAVGAFHLAGVECSVFDLARRPASTTAIDAVVALIRRAGLLANGLVVLSAELLADQPDAAHLAAALFAAPIPVVLVGRTHWNPAWHDQIPQVVTAEPLSTGERLRSWRRYVPAEYVDDRDLVQFRLTARQIDAAGQHIQVTSRLQDRPPTRRSVAETVRLLGGSGQLRDGSNRLQTGFESLQLPAETQSALHRLTDWVRLRDEVLAQGAVQGLGGKGSGISALFTGSPGTGKTLAAHVIADSTGLELMQVELSGVIDKYIGETEKNLERIFAEAENLNVVLFFDEADALFGTRSGVKDSRDRYANQEVSYLLQRMEQFNGITILATNLRGNLDPAFARRLHFIVHFPDPDEATRARLWRQLLSAAGDPDPADPVRIDELAKSVELTGGALRNIVLAATYDAAIERSPIGHRHIAAAAVREYVKLGRRQPVELL